ncbi:MAG: type IV secretion system DNA-binding domain-containing protein [Patescibacteria group bacterium]
MPEVNDDQEINFFAETNFRRSQRKFGIRLDDRRRHMYIVGKTGMGKTTMLENMIIQDIRNGHGLAFVDPHGDSSEKILKFVPPERINDVIYFNPADVEHPIAFNILETVDPNLRHMVCSGLIGIFKKIWADSWGPRLEYLLRNAILALLEYPGSTLLGVMRLLVDKAYRKRVLSKVEDPVVKSFWVDEYARYPDKFAQEAIAPIQNKIGQFLSNFLIRNVVGQVKSSFDIRQVMDEGKILILNLSKGRIGEDTAQLLGAMMISKIQIAAMTRVDMPEENRKDFFLYVDEFQNFATESFANILSEARKYRLDLVMAHQYITQLSDEVKAAVFGNVGTMIIFRVGAADASELVVEFTPRFTEEDLVNLTKFEIYLKLMIDGVSSEPFSARTLPPLFTLEEAGVAEKIIKVSRERYSRDRAIIEDKIIRWSTGEAGDEEEKEGDGEVEKPRPAAKKFETPTSASRQFQPASKSTPRPAQSAAKKFERQDDRPRSKPKTDEVKMEEVIVVPKEETVAQEKKPQVEPKRGVNFLQNLPKPPTSPKVTAASSALQSSNQDQTVAYEVINEKVKKLKNPTNPQRPYEVKCDKCGTLTHISFIPDPTRPVYCKKCLKEQKKKGKEEVTKVKEQKKEEKSAINLKDLAPTPQRVNTQPLVKPAKTDPQPMAAPAEPVATPTKSESGGTAVSLDDILKF